MPDSETLLIFTVAAMILNVSPGPSNFFVMSRSVEQGTRAGLLSTIGLGAGSVVHVLATTFGVSAIILASATVFSVLKFAGAMYLIYLGIQCFRRTGKAAARGKTPGSKSGKQIFFEGALVELLNPKSALFYLALLPQFVDPAVGPVIPQFLILGTIAIASAIPCDALVAVLSGSFARTINQSTRIQRMQDWLSGSVLLGVGVYMAIASRDD